MTSELDFSRVVRAGAQVRATHAGDVELIRPGATAHGVSISEGDLFQGMSWDAYNIRLPIGDEYEARRLSTTRGVAKLCIDYRQSAQVASLAEREGLVAWADAGGAAQPEKRVLDVDMEFWESMIAINPDMIAYLFAHLEVCGGANHHTGGKIKKLRETQVLGQTLERRAITGYVNDYERQLKKLNRKMEIKKGLVEIGPNNRFSRVAWI